MNGAKYQVAGSEFPGHYPGENHSWDLEKFKDVSSCLFQSGPELIYRT